MTLEVCHSEAALAAEESQTSSKNPAYPFSMRYRFLGAIRPLGMTHADCHPERPSGPGGIDDAIKEKRVFFAAVLIAYSFPSRLPMYTTPSTTVGER
jgi:hypothetical protein